MAVGRTMAPLPSVLLSLALCLGQLGPSREQAAQLGPEFPRNQSVTLVCRGPAALSTFRLQKKHNSYSCSDPTHEQCQHTDLTCERHLVQKCEGCYCMNSSCVSCNPVDKCDSGETEARFLIGAVNGNSAGCYHCLYHTGSQWSEHTDPLELVVTTEDVSDWTPGEPQLPSPSDSPRSKSPQLQGGQSLDIVYIIRTAALVFLLFILLLLLFHWHRKFGTPRGKAEKGRWQESSILAGDRPEKTPGLATVDGPLMLDRTSPVSPIHPRHTTSAGGSQEVTYAHLDHCILTQRAPGAAPSRTADLTANDCTYAALARP